MTSILAGFGVAMFVIGLLLLLVAIGNPRLKRSMDEQRRDGE